MVDSYSQKLKIFLSIFSCSVCGSQVPLWTRACMYQLTPTCSLKRRNLVCCWCGGNSEATTLCLIQLSYFNDNGYQICVALLYGSYGSSVGLVLVASCVRKVAVIKQQRQEEMFTESFMKIL